MARFAVVGVRKELVGTGPMRHEHLVGVVTSDLAFHLNAAVVRSLEKGDVWQVSAAGFPGVQIRPATYCPGYACLHSPYLTTASGRSERNVLEDLPVR